MNKLNNKKGISLIVLVITIIVMIVLAAAIILSLQSSNIIERANEAKVKNDIASAKELVAVANSEWLLMTETKQEQNGGDFVTYAETKLDEAGYEADNYVVSEGGTVEECEAMIGNVKYTSFRKAANSLEDETAEVVITIMKDIVLTKQASFWGCENVILDLNGHSITKVGADNGLIEIVDSKLTIKDTSKEGTGKIESIVNEDNHARYDATFDFDDDGYITKAEVTKLLRHTSRVETIKDEALLARCDVNNDGTVDANDVTTLLRDYASVDYAIYNSGELIIDTTMEGKIIGKPTAVYEN